MEIFNENQLNPNNYTVKHTVSTLNEDFTFYTHLQMNIIEFGTELANKILFLPERFERGNRLFFFNNTIYIDQISIHYWMSKRNRGWFHDLFHAIMKNGYECVVFCPMGEFDLILKYYGFRIFYTDSNNYLDEPLYCAYCTQKMYHAKRIDIEITHLEGKMIFVMLDEKGEGLGYSESELGDNYEIIHLKIHKKIDQILYQNLHSGRVLASYLKENYANGYRIRLLAVKRYLTKHSIEN